MPPIIKSMEEISPCVLVKMADFTTNNFVKIPLFLKKSCMLCVSDVYLSDPIRYEDFPIYTMPFSFHVYTIPFSFDTRLGLFLHEAVSQLLHCDLFASIAQSACK